MSIPIKKQKESAAKFAHAVRIVVEALREEGFNEAQSIQMVSATLSGAKVYVPFAGLTLTDHADTMKR